MKRFLLGLILIVGFAGVSAAANPETFNVNLTLRQVITIANTAALDFGTLEVIAGAYTVNPNAGPHSAGTGAAAATFDVTGQSAAVADVSFVTNPITITNGTTNISVTLSLASATHTFTGGTDNVFVGGSLTLAGTETTAVSAYTGTAQLQMVYQ